MTIQLIQQSVTPYLLSNA